MQIGWSLVGCDGCKQDMAISVHAKAGSMGCDNVVGGQWCTGGVELSNMQTQIGLVQIFQLTGLTYSHMYTCCADSSFRSHYLMVNALLLLFLEIPGGVDTIYTT